jgi:hypothetical protein
MPLLPSLTISLVAPPASSTEYNLVMVRLFVPHGKKALRSQSLPVPPTVIPVPAPPPALQLVARAAIISVVASVFLTVIVIQTALLVLLPAIVLPVRLAFTPTLEIVRLVRVKMLTVPPVMAQLETV